jgi:predicted Zn finger-like uncharacterized protein
MKVQCPNCQAQYQVDPAKIPAKGRGAKCSSCGRRFVIQPPGQRPAPKRKAASSHPAGVSKQTDPPKQKAQKQPAARSSARPLKKSTYQTLYQRMFDYYQSRDQGYRYVISAFSFAYRDLSSTDFIRSEVKRLVAETESKQKELGRYQREGDERAAQATKDEIQRNRGMISVFRDLIEHRRKLMDQGVVASVGQIYSVLRDVELVFLR